jgi:hypothetical protein
VQRDVAQLLDRLGQARPFVIRQLAGAQMGLVDPTDRAHDAHRQLGGTHFHGEHGHGQAFVQGHVLGDVDGQRRLAHAGPRGQHDQVTRLESRGHAVQVVKAGGHAGDVVGVVGHLLHTVQQLHHQAVHRLEALLHARAFLADVEHLLLGLVQDALHRTALRIESAGGDLVAGTHQLAQDGALAHDLRVAADVACARDVLRQRVQVRKAAGFVGLAQVLQLLMHRDHIGRAGGVDQRADRGVDQPVLKTVEVAVGQKVADTVPRAVVQQQATQHAGLGFDGVWRNAQLRHLAVGRESVFNRRQDSGHSVPQSNL